MFSSRSGLVASAGLIALLATACGQADTAQTSSAASDQVAASTTADGPLKVVATTTQVADFARNIGGDKVTVTQILRPNVDPHDYEPSPADIQAIADADVVVKNGVGLEKWLDQVISSAGFEGQVVDAGQGVTVRKGDGSEEESAGDPHIWHNPQNAKIMSTNIEKAFAAKDAPDAAAYQANLDTYGANLDALDTDIAQRINTIPAAQRKLVTNHDAFGYYIDRYHLTFIGSIIPSFDTSAELSAKQISDLVAKIKATGVTAVFSESSLPPKTAQAIGTEAGVKVEAGEDSLYGDTLGPEGSAGATYLDMEKHNTDVIVGTLNG
ncbi:metal ABC transporter substrate-binding protein [Streptosporangium subroseum]|uniref:metal ABC transporter substrate-binding protein n=1 Tax=Streptosporangium subroseum TaxID=106412 RepID=UPI00308AE436|nr:metal ABC transporter substrate-binding protein [Streptosporangium subroseum]